MKGTKNWYPPSENKFEDDNVVLPPKRLPKKASASGAVKLMNWEETYTFAVRQGTVRQETIMLKMGTAPHYV